jgi:type I restriction enzyme S subunit
MNTDWSEVKLEQVAEDITVGHVGPMADEYVSEGVPFLRSLNVAPFNINLTDIRYIRRAFHERLAKSALSPGDVVIVRTGKPGACAIIPDWLSEANCSDLVIVRPGSMIRPRYVSYVINSTATAYIDAYTVGAVQQHFNVGAARQIRFKLPPVAEQDRIIGVLGNLDDKIELNHRMNETIEAMARAIFKDWFVNFGPTRARIAGDAPYLAPDLWALFPDRLDGEGLPEGWSRRPLDQIAHFLNGLALQKYPPVGSDYLPVIKIADLRAGAVGDGDTASVDIPAEYVVDEGDVIFSWSGSLLCRVWTGGRGALNQHLFKVTSSAFPKWFFFSWIGEHMESFRATAASKATTMGHIQRRHLTEAATVVASPAIMKAADALIAPLFEKAFRNDIEARALATTRDVLLPKLMSGEIRVKDADAVLEAVA